jgi:hypothetical protein
MALLQSVSTEPGRRFEFQNVVYLSFSTDNEMPFTPIKAWGGYLRQSHWATLFATGGPCLVQAKLTTSALWRLRKWAEADGEGIPLTDSALARGSDLGLEGRTSGLWTRIAAKTFIVRAD